MHVTQSSIEAVIHASAGCAEALDAGIVKNLHGRSPTSMEGHELPWKVTHWRNRILMFMHENAVCTRLRVRSAGVRMRVHT